MARKLPQKDAKGTLDTILSELVSQYGKEKAKLDEAKKSCDALNNELKTTMQDNDITEYSADGYKVKYIVSERETMNEDKLIVLLTNSHKELCDNLGLIKMRPYVDFDAIEKEIYNGNIPEDVLKDIGKCKEVKEVVQIRLSKEK